MTTTSTGRQAEDQAAAYLAAEGYEILARNWHNRWCELDIIARQGDEIHFIEVKYRRHTTWGTGFDYITPDKITRLKRAALAWTWANHYDGPYQIGAVAVTGDLRSPTIELRAGVIA